MDNPMSVVPKSSPKDVFSHLLTIVALYVGAISFITLLFELINTWYPDPLAYSYGSADSIRWSASLLIVMFPVFLGMTWMINKELAKDPAKREIRVRKWLGYLTLFVSAMTVLIDVATLVYNLLGGEFTIRFILKVLTILVVAGLIFFYYLRDLRKKTEGVA